MEKISRIMMPVAFSEDSVDLNQICRITCSRKRLEDLMQNSCKVTAS